MRDQIENFVQTQGLNLTFSESVGCWRGDENIKLRLTWESVETLTRALLFFGPNAVVLVNGGGRPPRPRPRVATLPDSKPSTPFRLWNTFSNPSQDSQKATTYCTLSLSLSTFPLFPPFSFPHFLSLLALLSFSLPMQFSLSLSLHCDIFKFRYGRFNVR